jgi:uncharacterized membrane protein
MKNLTSTRIAIVDSDVTSLLQIIHDVAVSALLSPVCLLCSEPVSLALALIFFHWLTPCKQVMFSVDIWTHLKIE